MPILNPITFVSRQLQRLADRFTSDEQTRCRSNDFIRRHKVLITESHRHQVRPAVPFREGIVAGIAAGKHDFRIALDHGLYRNGRSKRIEIGENVFATAQTNQLTNVMLAVNRVQRTSGDLVKNADCLFAREALLQCF